MPINMACPSCSKTLAAPDTAAGKRAKCPACGQIMIVPAAQGADEFGAPLPSSMSTAPQSSSPESWLDNLDGSTKTLQADAAATTAEQRRPCPECGEMIIVGAAKCRFCNAIFDPRLRGRGYRSLAIYGNSGELAKQIRKCYTAWWMCFVIGLVVVIGGAALAAAAENPALLVVVAFGGLAIFAGAISYFVLVYKLWQTVQDGRAQTTPGSAVGLMFVPCFNIYWRFVAIWGLSKELNRISREYNIGAPQANEGLALTECILFCCGAIPYLGVLPLLAGAVISFVVMKNMCDTAAVILGEPSV